MVMWASCDGPMSFMWWSYELHVMVLWASCDVMSIMWLSCDLHNVMAMWASCDGHVSIMWWSCELHVMVMWASCDGHGTLAHSSPSSVAVGGMHLRQNGSSWWSCPLSSLMAPAPLSSSLVTSFRRSPSTVCSPWMEPFTKPCSSRLTKTVSWLLQSCVINLSGVYVNRFFSKRIWLLFC